MTTNDAFERNLSDWLRRGRRAPRARPPRRRSCSGPRRPASDRHGRASKGGSPWIRPSVDPSLPGRCRCGRWRSCSSSACSSRTVDRRDDRHADQAARSRSGWRPTAGSSPAAMATSTCSTGPMTPLGSSLGGDGFDFSPIFSRDGTRMIFLRSDGPIARAGHPDAVRGEGGWFRGPGGHAADREPGLVRLVARRDPHRLHGRRGALYVIDVDAGGEPRRARGSGARALPDVAATGWQGDRLPPRGWESGDLRGRSRGSERAPAAVEDGPDQSSSTSRGSRPRRTVRHDLVHAVVSRTGSRGCSPWTWRPGRRCRSPWRPVRVRRASVVSRPTGPLVAYARTYGTGFQIVVANADGTGNERPIGPTTIRSAAGAPSWAFTPDGTGPRCSLRRRRQGQRPSSCRSMDHPRPSSAPAVSSSSTSSASRPDDDRRPCTGGRARPRGLPGRRRVRRGYNRAMAHRVTLIPGDGIGPELAEATRRVLDATGIGFDWEVVDAGEAVMAEYGTPLPEHVLESVRRNKVALKGPITTPVGGGVPERQRDAPPGARAVREPAAGALDEGPRDPLRGRRPRDRPREHRGPVRRHRAHGRPRCRREHQDHHPRGVRADRPLRLRVRRRQRPAQGHGRAQGQHHEAVRRPVPRELPDGRRRVRGPDRVRGPHRRQHVHAARPEARPVRRARPAEPVRRHRQRPRGRAWSAASASRPAPTSGPRRPSSSRSTARRPSTRASTRPTRPR